MTKSRSGSVDVAAENQYWKANFPRASHVDPKLKYADYEAAYRFGWESHDRHPGRNFDDLYVELQRDWDMHRGDSPLTWEKAKEASRAAWLRVSEGTSGDDATESTPVERKPFETNSTLDRGDERR